MRIADHPVFAATDRTHGDSAAQHIAPSQNRGLGDDAMRRVSAYIAAHITENISLEQLAAAACISRFHFARRFRARTGLSPMAYVNRERIEVAKHLLACRHARISNVAVAVGFFDQSHFTRVFRKLNGMPPGCYARHGQRERAVPGAEMHLRFQAPGSAQGAVTNASAR